MPLLREYGRRPASPSEHLSTSSLAGAYPMNTASSHHHATGHWPHSGFPLSSLALGVPFPNLVLSTHLCDQETRPTTLLGNLDDMGDVLDRFTVNDLFTLSFPTSNHVRQEHCRPLFDELLLQVIEPFFQAHGTLRGRGAEISSHADQSKRNERAIELLHASPALFQSKDGGFTRQ